MSISSHFRSRAGLLAVGGGAVLWGTTGVAVSVIHDRSGLAALPIGCLRLAVGALVLTVMFRGAGIRRMSASLHKHRWSLVLAGAGLGCYQALYFIGVQEVGVSVSTLVSLAVAPVVLTIAAAVTSRRRPRPSSLLTLLCAVGGLALISQSAGSATGDHPLLGLLASLGSGLGYAATTLLNRRLAADGEPLLLTAATSAIGAMVLVPFALPFGLRRRRHRCS